MKAREIHIIRRNAIRGSRRLNDFDRRRIYNAFLDGGRNFLATADRFRISTNHLRGLVRQMEEKIAA